MVKPVDYEKNRGPAGIIPCRPFLILFEDGTIREVCEPKILSLFGRTIIFDRLNV